MALDVDSLSVDRAPRVLHGAHSYRLLRKLGEGGQGLVFEAEDLQHGKRVALKLLRKMSDSAVARFKREFRIREQLTHPCLVELGELGLDEGQWFFSMALIAGRPLLAYIEGSEERMRASFAQLAEAIAALHAAGVVHRDIKPDNILVESDGRLVLLDLGLAVEVGPSDAAQAVGTPAYMAPEQWGQQPIAASVDWYAFGVILFEAITGKRPFDGTHSELFVAKTERAAPPVLAVAPHCPADLAALCDGLLQRVQGARLGQAEVFRCFTDYSPTRVAQAELHSSVIGRAAELERMTAALDGSAAEHARVFVIEGESGIGKSAFLRTLAERARARGFWVLSGRCYESESVPFKAFDQMFDNLARSLRNAPPGTLNRFRPRNSSLLGRIFPGLSFLKLGSADESRLPPDPAEVKSRAFAALAEMFERMAEAQPLLICLDDVHWADGDSLQLLEALSKCGFPLLLVLSQRPDGTVSRAVRALAPESSLTLAPLDVEATRLLAESVSARLAGESQAFFERVHAETGGSPFLICEWARHVHLHGTEPTLQLGRLLHARIAELAPSRRRLLTVVAVSSEPIDTRVAAHVADSDEIVDAMGLRRDRLVRTFEHDGAGKIDVYHDRIRQVVCDALDGDERKALHRRVSEELSRIGAPPERRIVSQLAAGDAKGAADSALAAAQSAERALAFLRAAEFYDVFLELASGDDAQRVEVLVQRANAFQNAMRPRLAADCLVEASRHCGDGVEGRRLLRLAGEQYLLSGDLERGVSVLEQALAEQRLALPESAAAALVEAMQLLKALTERGLDRKPGALADAHAESRVELCLSIARCFLHVDLRGLPFAVRALFEALDVANPVLHQQALAVFVMVCASHLPSPLIEPAFERCTALTSELGTPQALALRYMAEIEVEHFNGRYVAAERACERAERTLIDHCVGVSRELGQIRSTLLVMAHSDRGDFRANLERAPFWLDDADRRHDRFYGNWLRAAYSLVWMAQDQPARARREIARAEAEWAASKGGTFETACALYLDAICRYEDAPGTYTQAAQGRPSVLASPVANSPLLQGYLHLHRAWGALRELGARPKLYSAEQLAKLEKQLDRAIRCLRVLALPVWSGAADALEANKLVLKLQSDDANDLLERAYGSFMTGQNYALAACVRRRWGEILGGNIGLRWVEEADVELRRLGVLAPARFARAYFSPFSATEYDRCSEPTIGD